MDKTLVCRECGVSFVFTQGEQEFYQSRGLSNPPSRCPKCRAVRRAQQQGMTPNPGAPAPTGFAPRPIENRPMFPATCARCGQPTQVPFQPRGDRPVFCSACFHAERPATPSAPRPSVPTWLATPSFTPEAPPLDEGRREPRRPTRRPERIERGDRVRYNRRDREVVVEDEDNWYDVK